MTKHDGTYYLQYARWEPSPTYGDGYNTADHPLGPLRIAAQPVLLEARRILPQPGTAARSRTYMATGGTSQPCAPR